MDEAIDLKRSAALICYNRDFVCIHLSVLYLYTFCWKSMFLSVSVVDNKASNALSHAYNGFCGM